MWNAPSSVPGCIRPYRVGRRRPDRGRAEAQERVGARGRAYAHGRTAVAARGVTTRRRADGRLAAMNDTAPSTNRLSPDGRVPGSSRPAVASRPQVLADGRSPLPDVRRRALRQRVDRLLATAASGLTVVDPRSALLAAMALGPAASGRSHLVVVAVPAVADDRRAEA